MSGATSPPQPEQDEDLDLYHDILEDFVTEKESRQELQQKYEAAVQKAASLEKRVKESSAILAGLEKKNIFLQKNISMLYKTACAEIKRKDSTIQSLREQLDSYEQRKLLKKMASAHSKPYETSNRKPYYRKEREHNNRIY
ncbi:uncharacterized protein LOC115222870 isoform X2 [Argonauta hians]